MVNLTGTLDDGIRYLMNAGGQYTQINVYDYTFATGSNSYDDETVKTLAGSSLASGLVFPLGKMGANNSASIEAMMLEQGKLSTEDKKIYVFGSTGISGNSIIELGSNTNNMYTVIPEGIQEYSVLGSSIYKQVFIRKDIAGSLF